MFPNFRYLGEVTDVASGATSFCFEDFDMSGF